MTGDRQKIDIEGTRRLRNHRPTRKRKIRCYGQKEKKNAKQRKMKCMQGYLDRSRGVENLSRRSQPRWIEKLSSIYQGDRNFLDRAIERCRD